MLGWLFVIAFVFVGQGILFFEEETLILLCVLFLLDVLGGFLVRYVFSELELRGDTLKSMLTWYFMLKIEVLSIAAVRHKERLAYVGLFDKLLDVILFDSIDYLISQYLTAEDLISEYELETDLVADTLEISLYALCYDLRWLLSVVEEHKFSSDIFIPESPYRFAIEILSVAEHA